MKVGDKKKKQNTEEEKMVRVAITIKQKHVEYLRKRNISPSWLLRMKIDAVMENEKNLMEK